MEKRRDLTKQRTSFEFVHFQPSSLTQPVRYYARYIDIIPYAESPWCSFKIRHPGQVTDQRAAQIPNGWAGIRVHRIPNTHIPSAMREGEGQGQDEAKTRVACKGGLQPSGAPDNSSGWI